VLHTTQPLPLLVATIFSIRRPMESYAKTLLYCEATGALGRLTMAISRFSES
jgi:hypothetical protein